ncbi:MAG: 50S ribosomal protein L24 [Acidobacteriota bacterium]
MHVKKNDTVYVLSGKDRGRKGRVLSVNGRAGKAIVEGIAEVKRHTRPNPQKNIKGGVVTKEAPVQVSNLMVVCGECGKPTRVGRRFLEDGSKVRVCRKCNGILDKSRN